MTLLETSLEHKILLPKQPTHVHNPKPGWGIPDHNVGNIMKHNSEVKVNVITTFGNCNVASRGTQGTKLLLNTSLLTERQAVKTPENGVNNLTFFPQSLQSQLRQHNLI